jgi:hypothetical protein
VSTCKQAINHNQPDIIYVQHEKPNTVSVDDIRDQVNRDIDVKPYASRYKIYIIDEAEKMNVQAQNALLKTIEEPPALKTPMELAIDMETFSNFSPFTSESAKRRTKKQSSKFIKSAKVFNQGAPMLLLSTFFLANVFTAFFFHRCPAGR